MSLWSATVRTTPQTLNHGTPCRNAAAVVTVFVSQFSHHSFGALCMLLRYRTACDVMASRSPVIWLLCHPPPKKKKGTTKMLRHFGVIQLTCQELITITQHEPDSTQHYSNNALLKKKYSRLRVLKRKKHPWLHVLKKYHPKPQNTQYPPTDSTYILPIFEYSCVVSSANHFEVKRSE